MAKKNNIQVTTVRKFANIKVIELNAQFIAKVFRAHFAIADSICYDKALEEVDIFFKELIDAFMGEEEEKSPKQEEEDPLEKMARDPRFAQAADVPAP